MPNPQDGMPQVLTDWQQIQSDPRWAKLPANSQSFYKDYYYKNMVMQDPQIQAGLQADPKFGPAIQTHFYADENLARLKQDAETQRRNESVLSQPIELTSDGKRPFEGLKTDNPSAWNGVVNTAQDMTSLKNLALVGGLKYLGAGLGAGYKMLKGGKAVATAADAAVTANNAMRIAKVAGAGVSGYFAADMAHGVLQGSEAHDEYLKAAAQYDESGDKATGDYYRGMASQIRAQQVIGGVMSAFATKHAYTEGLSSATSMPTSAEALKLKRLGYNPRDFKGRLQDIQPAIQNKVRSPRIGQGTPIPFTPPTSGAQEGASSADGKNSTPQGTPNPAPNYDQTMPQSPEVLQQKLLTATTPEAQTKILADHHTQNTQADADYQGAVSAMQQRLLGASSPEEQSAILQNLHETQAHQQRVAENTELKRVTQPRTTAPDAQSQVVSQPKPVALAPPSATLPTDLTGAAPRYKSSELNFNSDIDKALYIVAQQNLSKRDADFMSFLRPHFPGLPDDILRGMGQEIRGGHVKDAVANFDPSSGTQANIPVSPFAQNALDRAAKTTPRPVSTPAPQVQAPGPTNLPSEQIPNNGIPPEINRAGITNKARSKGQDAFEATLTDADTELLKQHGITADQVWKQANAKTVQKVATPVASAQAAVTQNTEAPANKPRKSSSPMPQIKSSEAELQRISGSMLADSSRAWIRQVMDRAGEALATATPKAAAKDVHLQAQRNAATDLTNSALDAQGEMLRSGKIADATRRRIEDAQAVLRATQGAAPHPETAQGPFSASDVVIPDNGQTLVQPNTFAERMRKARAAKKTAAPAPSVAPSVAPTQLAANTRIETLPDKSGNTLQGNVISHIGDQVKFKTDKGTIYTQPRSQVQETTNSAPTLPEPPTTSAKAPARATPAEIIQMGIDMLSKGRKIPDKNLKGLEGIAGRKLVGLAPRDQISELKAALEPYTAKGIAPVDYAAEMRKLGYSESQIAGAPAEVQKLVVESKVPAPKTSDATAPTSSTPKVDVPADTPVPYPSAEEAPSANTQGVAVAMKPGTAATIPIETNHPTQAAQAANTSDTTSGAAGGESSSTDLLQKASEMAAKLSAKGRKQAVETIQQTLKDQGKLGPEESIRRYHEAIKALAEGDATKDPLALKRALDAVKGFDPPDRKNTLSSGVDPSEPVRWLWNKFRGTQIPVDSPNMQKILTDQTEPSAKSGPNLWERIAALPSNVIKALGDKATLLPKASPYSSEVAQKYLTPSSLADPRLAGSMDRVSATLGRPLDPSESPHATYWSNVGGAGGGAEAGSIQLASVHSEALHAGLGDQLKAYLNLTGYADAIGKVKGHMQAALDAAESARTERDLLRRRVDAGLVPSRDRANVESKIVRLTNQMRESNSKAKDYHTSIVEGRVNPNGMDEDTIKSELDTMQAQLGTERFNKVHEMAMQTFKLMRTYLDAAHQSGIVSDAVYKSITDKGISYVPMRRIMEDAIGNNEFFRTSKGDLPDQKFLRKLEGSTRTNLDPIQAMHDQIQRTTMDIARNDSAKSLVSYLQNDPAFAGDLREVGSAKELKPGEGSVSFYHEGKQYTYAVPGGMADVFAAAHPAEINVFTKMLQAARNVFAQGTTIANPAFASFNALRDIQDMVQLSKAGPKSPADYASLAGKWASAARDVYSKSPDYLDMLRSGASFSGLQKTLTPAFFSEYRAPKSNALASTVDALAHPIRTLADLNNVVEQATKLTTFRELRDKGWNVRDAAWETRNFGGSPDFARHGTAGPLTNMLFMFFNANVQGIGRTLNRLSSDPMATAKMLAIHTMAMSAMHNWNSKFRDEDGQALWDRIPAFDKQNYYCVMTSHDLRQTAQGAMVPQYVRFPKGHVGQIVDNAIQDGLESSYYGGDSATAYQNAINLMTNLIPGQVILRQGHLSQDLMRNTIASANPLIREGMEQQSGPGGTDYFRNTPIEPRHLNNMAGPDAYVPSTSKTMREVAGGFNAVPGLAETPVIGQMLTRPMRLQHAVEGATGGLGQIGLNLLDTAQGQSKLDSNGVPFEGSERIRHLPGIGPIVGRVFGSNIDAREHTLTESFYDAHAKAQQAHEHLNYLKQTNPAQAQQLVQDPDFVKQVQMYGPLQEMAKRLSQSRRNQIRISSDPNIDVPTKRSLIGQLYNQRMQIMQTLKQNGLIQ